MKMLHNKPYVLLLLHFPNDTLLVTFTFWWNNHQNDINKSSSPVETLTHARQY